MLWVCCGVVACCAEAINTGPLEATIHNLGKEIDFKTKEGQELQRRWITKQTELVALQVSLSNSALTLSQACCATMTGTSRLCCSTPSR